MESVGENKRKGVSLRTDKENLLSLSVVIDWAIIATTDLEVVISLSVLNCLSHRAGSCSAFLD